jgi:hypothetical protein
MTTYTIYLDSTPIACVNGAECAYTVYRKTVEIAEMLGKSARLVNDDSGEEVASYEEDDYEDDVDECGFDPYEGCYTYDC